MDVEPGGGGAVDGQPVGGGAGGSIRFVRLLVVLVAVECALALVMRSPSVYRVAVGGGDGRDYLAAAGVLWIIMLAGCALLVARRMHDLARQVRAQDVDLEAMAQPRRRLAAIVHRTDRVLAGTDELAIALQPIVDLENGRWVGVEALARFPDNDPPERWFAEAHEAGRGVALEKRMVHDALLTLPRLPPGVGLSVNASPALILDPGFAEVIEGAGAYRDRLTIEITEHAAVARYEDIRAALLPHRERGVRLAVDDTGAGYASFAHVLLLRPDVIKLDRSLLVEISRDAARRAFVTAIVLLALELDAAVTAEGVETADELDVLRSLGIDTVQGYLLARPSARPEDWASWAGRNWAAHCGMVPARSPLVDGELTGTGPFGRPTPT